MLGLEGCEMMWTTCRPHMQHEQTVFNMRKCTWHLVCPTEYSWILSFTSEYFRYIFMKPHEAIKPVRAALVFLPWVAHSDLICLNDCHIKNRSMNPWHHTTTSGSNTSFLCACSENAFSALSQYFCDLKADGLLPWYPSNLQQVFCTFGACSTTAINCVFTVLHIRIVDIPFDIPGWLSEHWRTIRFDQLFQIACTKA